MRTEPSCGGRRTLAAPLFTLALGACALLLWLIPQAADAAQLARTALRDDPAGQWWTLFSAHLTHYSFEHLALDLAVFSALGVFCERREPVKTRATMIASMLVIATGFLAFEEGLESYRGLSGLDTALFALLLVTRLRADGPQALVMLWSALFVAKLSLELSTGNALFVDSRCAGFVPVPSAHALGAIVGACSGWLGPSRARCWASTVA